MGSFEKEKALERHITTIYCEAVRSIKIMELCDM